MSIYTQKIKLRDKLIQLHRHPHGKQIAHVLAGLALTLGMLPPLVPPQPTKVVHLIAASVGLPLALLLLALVLNQTYSVLRWIGSLPSGATAALLLGGYIELLRRKGGAYLNSCQNIYHNASK